MFARKLFILKPKTASFVYIWLLSFLNSKSGLHFWSETLTHVQQKYNS